MEKFELKNTLFSYISRARNCGEVFIDEELRAKGIEGLAYSHIRIIIILNIYGKLSMKEVSEKISKDKSTVTSLVNKLERLGYVKKSICEKDKRVTFLELEDKSEEIVESVFQVAKIFHQKVESILTKEEIETLFFLMEKLVKEF